MTNYKERNASNWQFGTGFQHVIDSYFWNLPLDADVNKKHKTGSKFSLYRRPSSAAWSPASRPKRPFEHFQQ
jgi:hypothetical protein